MKSRMLRVLVGFFTAAALALAGGVWAQSASVTATVSNSTLTVTGSASTSGLSAGNYNALVTVTNSSGATVISGSNSFTIGAAGGRMTLTTVGGITAFSGMSVTNTAPEVCGTYSNPSEVIIGYMAVMSSSGAISRYQIIQPGTGSSFCANLVLDSGANTILAAYASTSGALVVSNSLSVSNGSTSVNTGAARVQMTWNTANDMDLYLYAPSTSGGTATTSSSSYVYYGRTSVTGIGRLDVDDTSGYGPENITTAAITTTGRYLIKANAYSMGSATSTSVVLTVFTGSGQNLGSQTFNLTRSGQSYLMGYLNFTSPTSFTFEPLGTFAGDGSGQLIEPPPGYAAEPK